METEVALNLRPGDQVEIDGQWWTVTQHCLAPAESPPVTMEFRSADREFVLKLQTSVLQRFNFIPRDA